MTEQAAERIVYTGAKYCFRNTNAGCGEVFDSAGTLVYRYRPPESVLNVFNGLIRGPNFVFLNSSDREILRIERTKSFPKARFAVIENGQIKGRVDKRRPFSFEYTVELNDATWSFRIPLFAVEFHGTSSEGSRVLVHLKSELTWFVAVPNPDDNVALLATLAFLHSERCRA